MKTKPDYIKAILLGLGSLHPNTNTTTAEGLARLAYARERIHSERVMPAWEGLSHSTQAARQDAVCAVLDEVYFVARKHITPIKLFELLKNDATMDATVAKHEAEAAHA